MSNYINQEYKMPTQEEIDIYEELRPKIASVRDTIKALSSKKPD